MIHCERAVLFPETFYFSHEEEKGDGTKMLKKFQSDLPSWHRFKLQERNVRPNVRGGRRGYEFWECCVYVHGRNL